MKFAYRKYGVFMKLICLGDSLTYGYKTGRSQAWPALVGQKYGIKVLNKGINGDTSFGMLSRFYRDVVENKATHMIIMGGTNDLMWGVPLSVVKAQVVSIIEQAYYYGIIPIIGIPIPIETEMVKKYWPAVKNPFEVNREIMQYRDWIYEFSLHFQCNVIDFYRLFFDFNLNVPITAYYADGLHPTVEGNVMMAEAVKLQI
jgi:acyl-CoA thioesterase-1